jgi:hypothetical protein
LNNINLLREESVEISKKTRASKMLKKFNPIAISAEKMLSLLIILKKLKTSKRITTNK